MCFFCKREREAVTMLAIADGKDTIFKCMTCVANKELDTKVTPSDSPLTKLVKVYTVEAKRADTQVTAAIEQTAMAFDVSPVLVRYACFYQPLQKDEPVYGQYQDSIRTAFKENLKFMQEVSTLEGS